MNRDMYSIILNKAKHILPIMMQQTNGKWEKTNVHEDVIKGFGCCKCLLVCTKNANPAKQNASKLIDTWDRLLDIHHADNLYRLLPQHTSSTQAFQMLISLCSAPHSPFTIDDRIDFAAYQCYFAYKSPVRTAVENFFNTPGADRLPFDRISFDAVLRNKKESTSGLIVMRHTINLATIQAYAYMMKFITSPMFLEATFIDPTPWKEVLVAPSKRFLFLASESTIPVAQEKPLTEAALAAGILLYHRKGMDFHYLPPPPSGVAATVAAPAAARAVQGR